MDDGLTTNHADLRKMMRTDTDKSMTELWDEGFPCEVKHRFYDEARCNIFEDIVLLKNDGQVSTILYRESEEVTIKGDHNE